MQRVVVITGGAGGIGQACVEKFCQEDTVIVLDVNEKSIKQCKEKYHVDGWKVDLSDLTSIQTAIQEIIHRFHKIDVLVQAAGIMKSAPALDVSYQDFEKMIKVNVEGLFFVMQETVRQSMKNSGGVILNFASAAAIRGFYEPMASVHYSASKGAVVAMSRQLAVEWGKYNIRVNSIAPGGVMTPAMASLNFEPDCSMVPLKRLSSPQDIASTVYYLCSEQSAMITGQNIVVDGGSSVVGF